MSTPGTATDPTNPLQAFLAALPPDAPQEVRDLLASAVGGNDTGLPPGIYREAVEQLPLAISITDTKADILYANQAFADVTGYDREELTGLNESILSNKATPLHVYEDLWATITGGEVWNGHLVNRRKSEEPYVADLTVVPMKNAENRIVSYVGIHRDITDVHKLEQEVRNQKALIESVVQAAPVAMVVLDRNGRVLLDNNAYKALISDIKEAEPADRILAAVAEGRSCTVEDILSCKEGFSNVEVRIDSSGGREPRWLSCSGSWVLEYDGGADAYFRKQRRTGLLLVCNDITRQRRRYEEARTAMVRALMADETRVNAVRETIAAAIFQLQGPMNMVGAALGMLHRQGDGDVSLARVLQDAITSGKMALERLRNAMPAQQTEGVEPVNMNEVVRDVLDVSTDRFLSNGIVVNWRPMAVLPAVPARPGAMRALVKHLLDNAVDALSESGSADREIALSTRAAADGMVEVVVEDTGPGLAEEMRIKAFQPFFTGWRRTRGHSGMGLAIAQQAVFDQGGGIVVERGTQGGCRVRVTLSLRLPQSADPQEHRSWKP